MYRTVIVSAFLGWGDRDPHLHIWFPRNRKLDRIIQRILDKMPPGELGPAGGWIPEEGAWIVEERALPSIRRGLRKAGIRVKEREKPHRKVIINSDDDLHRWVAKRVGFWFHEPCSGSEEVRAWRINVKEMAAYIAERATGYALPAEWRQSNLAADPHCYVRYGDDWSSWLAARQPDLIEIAREWSRF